MGARGFLGEEWQQAQRDYWARWSASTDQPTGAESSSSSPWEAALDQWWQDLAPEAPELIQVLLEKSVAQTRQLFQMAELFVRERPADGDAFDWRAAIQQTFGNLGEVTAGLTGTLDPLAELMLDACVIDRFRDQLEQLFSPPGLGQGNHSQALRRELFTRLLAYQQAHQVYQRFFSDFTERAVSRLQEQVAALEAQGGSIDSARALYDLWISACEPVYAERVMSDEYVELYGTLINRLMAVKQQIELMLEEACRVLGIPTARDFGALEQRMHEDRQAIKRLQSELQELREAQPKKPGPRKKSATRKRTTARKKPHVTD